MKTEPNYKPLRPGDIRCRGDEVRHTGRTHENRSDARTYPDNWQPVSLIGHAILPADVIVAEFRRPV